MKKHLISEIEKNPNLIFSSFEDFKDELPTSDFKIFCISEGTLGNLYYKKILTMLIT